MNFTVETDGSEVCDLRTRIFTALAALCVLAPFIIFSETFMLEIFVSVLASVSVFEMLKCAGLDKKWFVAIPSYAVTFFMPVIARRVAPELSAPLFSIIGAIFFIYMFYLMTAAVFSHGKLSITEAATTFMLTVYVAFSFLCIILLRDIKNGQFIYLLIFISAWMTDSGAYFVGRFLGRHKLIEDVSPKKTVEGAVGGVVICVLSYLIYGVIVGNVLDAVPNYPALIILGVITSIISQCGDLIASLLKRHYKIKDYGYVFPGHGGVLDRFDSIIAVAAFLYIVISSSGFFELFF